MPFSGGYAYGRRASYFQHLDHPEDARRLLKGELRTADGKAFRIPEDLTADYTAIFFSVPEPWSSKYGDDLYSPTSTALSFAAFAESRPMKDSQAVFVILGEEPHMGKLSDHRRYTKTPCTMLALPGGLDNPLVSRMGMLSTNRAVNSVLVNKEGRILAMVSGLTKRADRGGYTLTRVVTRLDMIKTCNLLDQGEIEAAKEFIFTLAPPHDPNALDANGQPVKKPRYRLSHLRARARVYMALGEWEKALADAEEVYAKQFASDEGMSLRTDQLLSDEALRNEIADKAKAK